MDNVEQTRESTEMTAPVSEPVASEPKAESTAKPERDVRSALRTNLRASSEKVAAKNVEAAKAQVKPTSSSEIAPSPQVAQAFGIAAPADMSPEDKVHFAKLSPEMQAYVSKRAYETRADYSRKTQEVAQKEREISDVLGVVAPIRDDYARQGISVPDIVRRSLAWDKSFKVNRNTAAREYLDAYGVDPREAWPEMFGGQPITEQQQPEFVSREEAERIAEERTQKYFQKLEQQRVVTQNESVVKQFIESEPLFRDPGTAHQLEQVMAPVVQNLRITNPSLTELQLLQEACNFVKQTHPTFRDLSAKLTAKKDADEAAAAAEKAKRASRSISGGPGTGSPKLKAQNLRENLRQRLNGSR